MSRHRNAPRTEAANRITSMDDRTMGKTFAATFVALAAFTASAQTTLAPAEERIADRTIQADHKAYETLQGRIKGINDKGRPVRDYHLSKAQCWLDVSLHEYTRNDRSAFPQEAMTESEKLIDLMERAGSPKPLDRPWDTALVNQAAKLRPDLWARADALKKHRGFACATQRTACSEVELVHAGNEYNQQQCRHAKPYVQIAEDQLFEAERQAEACLPAPAPVVAVVPAPAPIPAVPAPQAVQLSANVVFNFDKHTAAEMRGQSRPELEAMAQRLKEGVKVTAIKLIGHADRLNSTGNTKYNQQLSEKRARTVRDYLVSLGVNPGLITFEYRGDTEQVARCDGKFKNKRALEECLLPNRRVEVQLSGVR
jgi:outer membrane protein OmpA-like peptidoglycan-associated protein